MARNLENINKVRELNGLPPMTAEEFEQEGKGKASDNPGSSDDDDPPNPDPEHPTNKPAPAPAPAPNPDPSTLELNDDQLVEMLKKKGISVTSLADLIPPPDPAAAAEKRAAEKLSFGLSKGYFSTRDHESYIRESSNPRDLVYAQYHREAKEEDPELSDEDINAEFEEKYGLNAPANTRKFKRGQDEINLLADRILQDRYKKIFEADAAYTKHEQSENDKRGRTAKILAKAPAYKADVESVFSELKKIRVAGPENTSYEIEVPDDVLQTTKNLFLDNEAAAEQIIKGWTTEQLKELGYTTLIQQNFNQFAFEVAKQYALKKQAGTKGIIPGGPQSKKKVRELTEDQKKVLADHGIKEEDLPPVSDN